MIADLIRTAVAVAGCWAALALWARHELRRRTRWVDVDTYVNTRVWR